MNDDHDVPILRRSLAIRSPRSVALLLPVQLPVVIALLGAAIVFTIFPNALQHSPIGFEERGVIHHIWHYSLLAGSALTLVGMLSASRRQLQIELIGLCLLVGVIGVNLVAFASGARDADFPSSGYGIAIRTGVLLGFVLRAWIAATQPTIVIITKPIEGE